MSSATHFDPRMNDPYFPWKKYYDCAGIHGIDTRMQDEYNIISRLPHDSENYQTRLNNFIKNIPFLSFRLFHFYICALVPNQSHESFHLIIDVLKSDNCMDRSSKAELLLRGYCDGKTWDNSNMLRHISDLTSLLRPFSKIKN